ncbi:MAG TPA: hypothetical protein DEP53_14110 [Bacteroidetes bacterium]|nr:hypothetical protein [Bacteroidota bacterium]
MNDNQLRMFWVGIVLISVFGLFPPWRYQFDVTHNGTTVREGGSSPAYWFHFILAAPSNPFYPEELRQRNALSSSDFNDNRVLMLLIGNANSSYSIDFQRLFIIWFLIALITAGRIYTIQARSVAGKEKSA